MRGGGFYPISRGSNGGGGMTNEFMDQKSLNKRAEVELRGSVLLSKDEKILKPNPAKSKELQDFFDADRWTTKQPTKQGYYWAYEKSSLEIENIKIEKVDLDNNTCICHGYEIEDSIDNYTHFKGPLEVPKQPIDCGVVTATGIDKDGNRFPVKKEPGTDKWMKAGSIGDGERFSVKLNEPPPKWRHDDNIGCDSKGNLIS